MTSPLICPDCAALNDATATHCHTCHGVLTHVAAQDRTPRPFHRRTFAFAAGISLAVVLLAQLGGVAFSLAVVPHDQSLSDTEQQLTTLVGDGKLATADASSTLAQLRADLDLRARLDSGALDSEEAMLVRDRLRPADQSVVLGMGGLVGLLPALLGMLLGGIVATAATRARRVREVALGVAAAALVQVALWVIIADFSVGALLGGALWMTGSGFGFGGAPVMLLGMTIVVAMGVASASAALLPSLLEVFTGKAVCARCDHTMALRPSPPAACPKCNEPQPERGRLRYRSGDDFLAEIGGDAAAVAGAELLCLRCAKTTTTGQCEAHPHEPLLDPSRDEVRFQLLELDSQAGTQRFARWTNAGLGIDAAHAAAAPTGPLLCMPCARVIEGERCPLHPEEPLLDPSRDDVRHELVAADDRARGRMGTGLTIAAFVVATLVVGGMAQLLDVGSSVVVPVFAGVLVALVTVSRVAVPKLAPPRYSQWTGEGHVDLDEFGMGAQATIFAPLRRAWKEAKAQSWVLLVAVVAGAGLGAATGVALDTSVVGLALVGVLVAFLGTLAVWSVRARVRGLREAATAAQAAWHDPYA
ncbi:MAG: hypothetical protein AAF721_05650, partial [Myxococcota bacterium]